MPAAIAITFFSAPAISQPTTSGFVYTRKVTVMNRSWSAAAVTGSIIATTDAAGWPAATSRARFGPVSTPMRSRRWPGEHVGGDLGHAQVRRLLDALGEADARAPRARTTVRDVSEHGAQPVGRHAEDEDVGVGARRLQVAGRVERGRQRDAGQVARVLVVAIDVLGERRVARPQRRRPASGRGARRPRSPTSRRPSTVIRSPVTAPPFRRTGGAPTVSGPRTHQSPSPGAGRCGYRARACGDARRDRRA